ncbi:hypothetical protein CSA56_16845 [candidate division KSB3 bacterium]|uniref:CRISPR type III-associated protein domain-containing protein n=1 Tax=candidate division KSB3 bacterium TaxID=2044937 RepID=A0A2G6K8E3_9BACT|nr:MAG: hypothetical protein CSA56_16845 [candidate division KSB3 bacterium]
MKYEFHAQFQVKNKEDIKSVTRQQERFASFDVPSRINLLAQGIVLPEKSYAQVGDRNTSMGLKQLVHNSDKYDTHIGDMRTKFMSPLKLITPHPERELLPDFSFYLSFSFRLAKPYISKDDESFYIIDNPLKKEKVFKVPYIAPSSWKGNFREALRLGQGLHDGSDQMRLLFGNSRESDEYRAGRLHFYPTYFNEMRMDVINPHDRATKAGKLPIYYEIAPAGAQGAFSLLYVPFDTIGQEKQERQAATFEHLELVQKGLEAMFLEYGFSAKKTSGYGVIEETFPEVHQTTLWVKNIPIYRTDNSQQQRQPMSKMAEWKQKLYQMQTHSRKEDTTFSSFQEMKQLIERIKHEAGVNRS